MNATTIGAYQLVGVIARGGAGVVYRARDPQARREVAIKVLLAGTTANKAQLERFERESVALARLKHPNVVGIHAFGRHQGSPYLVMDLVEGESLWDRLRRQGPLPAVQVAKLGVGVALALQHAHEHGILHRDLKPHNVLLEPSGRPRLTDFGLALMTDSSQGHLTKSGVLMGTPGFLPPEQAFENKDVGPPADVYGLGATLYAALTGVPPHSADDLTSFLATLATEEPTPPSELCPVDRALEAIVLKCLRKSPAERYPSAQALADDLARYTQGEGSSALHEQVGQRRRRWAVLSATITAGGLGFLGLLAWDPGQPRQVATTPASSATRVEAPSGDEVPSDDEDEEVWDDDWEQDTSPSPQPSGYAAIAEDALAGEEALLDLVQQHDTVRVLQAMQKRKDAWDLFTDDLDAAAALEAFDLAMELDPSNATGWGKRGFVLYALGDPAEARQNLDKALEMDPGDDGAYQYRGLLRAEEGDFEGALEDLTRSVQLKDNDDDSWIQRARIRLALGDPEGALSDVRRAVELGEVGQWRHAISARANLALGNLDEALADSTRAGVASPWGTAARAAIRLTQGDLNAACQHLAAAVAMLPPNLDPAHRDSARFESRLFQRQMFRDLVADLEAAHARLEPDDPRRAELSALLDRCRKLERTEPVFLPFPRR